MAFKPVIISISFGCEHFKLSCDDLGSGSSRHTAAHTEADFILCVGLNNVFQEEVTIGQAEYSKGQKEELRSTSLSSTEAPFAVNSLIMPLFTVWGHVVSGVLDVPLVTVNSKSGTQIQPGSDMMGKTYGLINLLSLFSSKRIHSKPQILIIILEENSRPQTLSKKGQSWFGALPATILFLWTQRDHISTAVERAVISSEAWLPSCTDKGARDTHTCFSPLMPTNLCTGTLLTKTETLALYIVR